MDGGRVEGWLEGGGFMRCVVGRWGLDVFGLDLA